jgi:hypothetical protein
LTCIQKLVSGDPRFTVAGWEVWTVMFATSPSCSVTTRSSNEALGAALDATEAFMEAVAGTDAEAKAVAKAGAVAEGEGVTEAEAVAEAGAEAGAAADATGPSEAAAVTASRTATTTATREGDGLADMTR